MNENHYEKRRPRRKKAGSSSGLAIGLAIGGIILLAAIGFAVYRTVGRGGKLDGAPPGSDLFALPNPRVTEPNYEALVHGMSVVEVEGILGAGRPPNTSDFDAIFGEKIPELSRLPSQQQRRAWEEFDQRCQRT